MQTITISSKGQSWGQYLKELAHYRDLFITFAIRDFKVKYAQTFLGFFWALFQQIVAIGVFSLIRYAAFDNENDSIPVVLYISAGIAAWTYFDFVVNNSANSIILSGSMIKKIYFPRLILPLSKALVGLIDYLIGLLLLALMFMVYGMFPSSNIIFLPLFILSTILAALGLGIWVSALTIRFRDFQHIVPFLLKIGMFITPVYFSAEQLIERTPLRWQPITQVLFYLNPMAGNIEAMKWSLFYSQPLDPMTGISFGVSAILFFTGLFYFKKSEKQMADLV
ncbi:MAG: ABC transporter permease [Reichenbachiella sp.]|uniref:ABC transporter permease n=1 Tax=Reichenbachiella sp. TaxID=2184521 RepID=UPI00326570B8